ncbi:MAG TPA: hypothetical protein VD884_05970 [Ohtaekwangia sp.]|nr:hypothetical protein [Ohtaekwangia sp.]
MSRYYVRVLLSIDDILAVEKEIVTQLPIFQTAHWLNSVGRNLVAIVCYDKQHQVKGYLPLVKTKKFGLFGYHIPPYTPYYGPTIFDENGKSRLLIFEQLIRPLKDEPHLDFKLPLPNNDLVPYLAHGFSIEALQTHVADGMSYDVEKLNPDKKRDVKRLLKAVDDGNLVVNENNFDLNSLLTLWEITSKRASFKSGIDHLRRIFFSSGVTSYYSNLIQDKHGALLASTYCPFDNNKMYHLIGASAQVDDSLFKRANILSLHLALQEATKKALSFDYEGSNISGIAQFYRMMSGEPKLVFRIQRTRSVYYNVLRFYKRIQFEKND